ncbi:type IV pilus modification PilV family protein [Neptunicella sp.]|uniref:type IV pilus modification PilV family protein n=1 Tax=Neptunicella sp. TaxID=2125986 RepID=UPI003F68E1CF
MPANRPFHQQGFNLIELVIGIILFSLALVLVMSTILPQSSRSVEPIYQVKATELAQSLLNEIIAKSFDQQSDRTGGYLHCETSTCTPVAQLGPDLISAGVYETREQFNDVDDYNDLVVIADSQGQSLADRYRGFSLRVKVFYDRNRDGIDDNVVRNNKLIRVTVTTPNNDDISFTTFRSNY